MKIFIFLLFFTASGTFAEERVYTSEKELGDGFIKRSFSVNMPPEHWEGIGHFSAVFYKGIELGQIDMLSISPNKNYASYVKSTDGKLYIFDLMSQKENQVIQDSYCFPYESLWFKKNVHLKCFGQNESIFNFDIDLSHVPFRALIVSGK